MQFVRVGLYLRAAGPEPITSAPRIPRPATAVFIVIGSSFLKVGFVDSIGSTLLLLLSLQRSRSSSFFIDRALYLFTTRASAAGIAPGTVTRWHWVGYAREARGCD